MTGIAVRIKYYRKKSGLTQEQVADKLGIKTSNYAKYEHGDRTPKDDRLIEIAKILGVGYIDLKIGAERVLIDLLHAHLKGAILGDVAGFYAYHNDMSCSPDIFSVINSFFQKWKQFFETEAPGFYKRYLANINLETTIELNNHYKNAERKSILDDPQKPYGGFPFNISNGNDTLDYPTVYKLAFCIAASQYLNDGDAEYILSEVQEATDINNDEAALMILTINVFGPFIAHITNALKIIDDNTTIDEFETAFLFHSFWLPVPDEDGPNEDTDFA